MAQINRTMNEILALAERYQMNISEIAGGSHSANSRHYAGVAVDVNVLNDKQVNSLHPDLVAFQQTCRDLGCTEVLGPGDPGHKTHLHAALPRL